MELLKIDLGSLGVLAKSISEPIVAVVEKEGKLANIHSLVEENLQKFIIAQGELEQKNEKELTKRSQADMLSDSKLSKNIRPMILVYLTSAFSLTYVLSYFGYTSQNVLLINMGLEKDLSKRDRSVYAVADGIINFDYDIYDERFRWLPWSFL